MPSLSTEEFKKHLHQHFHVPMYELDCLSDSQINEIADLIWDNHGAPGAQMHQIVAKAVSAAQTPLYKPNARTAEPPAPEITPGVRSVWRTTLISFEEFQLLAPADRMQFFRHQAQVRFVYVRGSKLGGADGGFRQAVTDNIMDITKWSNANIAGLWTHAEAVNLSDDRTKQGQAAHLRVRFLFELADDFKNFTNNYLLLKKLSTDV